MAKHRKTRKQKLRSDTRLTHALAPSLETTLPQQVQSPVVFTYSQKTSSTETMPIKTGLADTTFNYLGHDLRKTGLITGSIIVAEFILLLVIH